jgi:hypothetical protein
MQPQSSGLVSAIPVLHNGTARFNKRRQAIEKMWLGFRVRPSDIGGEVQHCSTG